MFWRISLPRLGHPLRLAGRWVCVGTTSMTPLPFQRASVLEFRKFTGRISENSDFVLDSHSCAFCLPLDPLRQGSVMFPFQAMLPLSDPGARAHGPLSGKWTNNRQEVTTSVCLIWGSRGRDGTSQSSHYFTRRGDSATDRKVRKSCSSLRRSPAGVETASNAMSHSEPQERNGKSRQIDARLQENQAVLCGRSFSNVIP